MDGVAKKGSVGTKKIEESGLKADTKIIKISGAGGTFTRKEEEMLKTAGEIIKSGGLVAFPTETVYGLGGDALNPESARKIYAAKGRPSDNPLIVHIAHLDDIGKVISRFPEGARKAAAAFWPGPLTMILEKSDAVPRETTGGLETVAVRMPSDRIAGKLIEYSGGYVAAPSANLSGRPSPTVAKYVIEDMQGRIDAIIDGGENRIGLESTIVDFTVSPPQILRPGFITAEMLEKVLEEQVDIDVTIMRDDTGKAPRAPGMKYRHYAPRGDMVIVEGEAPKVLDYINRMARQDEQRGEKVGVIASAEQKEQYHAATVKNLGSMADEESIAAHLYTALRELDDEGVTKIYSESFGDNRLGHAIMNRLLKAAGHQVVKV